ncbi:MAG: Calx-beta domain-containing protein, partial [Actinomycetota bacterium]
ERGTHGSGEASVQMTAEAITAAEGADFIGGTHTVRFSTPVEQAEVFLPVIDDDEVEDIEVVGLGLEQPTNGMVIAFPGTAEMSIIDDDGPSRVGFEDAEYSVFESRSSVDLWVIRAGSDSAPASVGYSTSDGTAVAGEDYASRSGTLSFGAGERAKRISVGIIDDGSASGEVSFDLTLGSPSGAELMTASARVVIRDDEGSVPADDTPPYTAFHQPLHGKVYRPGVVEEFLVFTQDDEQGSGIRKVEVALRKKLTSGRCAWWTGAGFRRGSCGEVRWSKEKGDYFTELTLFTMTKLKPSTKANGIRFYTAYSRGIDNVGNVQTALDRGQNRNDFEVRR